MKARFETETKRKTEMFEKFCKGLKRTFYDCFLNELFPSGGPCPYCPEFNAAREIPPAET